MNFLFIATKGTTFDLPIYIDQETDYNITVLDDVSYDPVNLDNNPSYEPIEDALTSSRYDYVMTYLFHTVISDICEMYGIPYISIIYDSPQVALFHPAIYNSTNRLFIFDRAEYDRLAFLDVKNIHHIPLFANTARTDRLKIDDSDQKKFSSDISFVGNLYEQNLYNEIRNSLAPEVLMPANEYLVKNMCNWHQIREWPTLDAGAVNYLKICNLYNFSTINQFEFPEEYYLGIILLSRKLGEIERLACLKHLSEFFDVDFYTQSKVCDAGKANILPPVNYYTELGKVYNCTKINLNITLPTIETGVPLRVYDIMAYGGFVMSNYQEEITEWFNPGEDIVTFKDLDEAKELCDYYLSHDDERKKIAENGYRIVHEKYTCANALDTILHLCEEY